MEHKIGVFICTGYGIGEALDIDALKDVVTKEMKVEYCQTIESCETDDLKEIEKRIQSDGLTKVVIAGISARLYEYEDFPTDVIVEKIALREHVVWCQPPNNEDTQMMAEDYLRMYITKISKMEPIEVFKPDEEINKSILVVGGGITGMTAAIEAAKTGYEVAIVEKSEKLGGWLGKQYKSIPTKAPFIDLEDIDVDEMINEINGNEHIKLFTSASTNKIDGAPGLFDVEIVSTGNGKPQGDVLENLKVGAIVQATGWKPKELDEDLPYTQLQNVIRNVDLEEIIRDNGKILRPSDGKEAKSVVFIQCGGCQDKKEHSYCSSICCLTSLKQSMYVRETGKNNQAFIFYEFMRTPGLYEDFYRKAQEDDGIFLTRGSVADITEQNDGSMLVNARDTMIGENIEIEADLVVMATGMVPNSADGEKIRALTDARGTLERAENDLQKENAQKLIDEYESYEGTEILNLNYRQGPDIPTLEFGFPDSHFICFPYESRRTGIYPAGSVRSPMDGVSAREDGTGAALKAIQCVEMTARGEAMHPRSGDKSYTEFYLERCTQCKRCTEECPFGVLNEDEKGTPLPQPTRCRRCGICLGACPERIISFKDYSVNIISSMIKAVEVPDEFDEKPRILALLCENDAFPALDLVGKHHLQYSPFVRIVPVRCLGSVNLAWIREAISVGYDGIILIGCKYGDDYQCHFVKGSELAASRGDNIREKLEQMQMENERVELHQLQISEYERLPEIFNNFAELIEEIGMNPFKDM